MNRSLNMRHSVDVIPTQLLLGATVTSDWLFLTDAVRLFVIVGVGATDVAVNAKLQQATSAAGANAKDIDGAAVTEFAITDNDKYASIDLEAARLDLKNGFAWVQLSITADAAVDHGEGQPVDVGGIVAATLLRTSRHQPPTQTAAYKQKVVVAG